MVTATHLRVTWNALVAAEPRLARVLEDARAEPKFKTCQKAQAVWYGEYKRKVERLVGFMVTKDHPHYDILRTTQAYDVAYHTVYNALAAPPCGRLGRN
jgi:hypothetical protein